MGSNCQDISASAKCPTDSLDLSAELSRPKVWTRTVPPYSQKCPAQWSEVSHTEIGTSIGSTVFAGLTGVSDRQTHRPTNRPCYRSNKRPHLMLHIATRPLINTLVTTIRNLLSHACNMTETNSLQKWEFYRRCSALTRHYQVINHVYTHAAAHACQNNVNKQGLFSGKIR